MASSSSTMTVLSHNETRHTEFLALFKGGEILRKIGWHMRTCLVHARHGPPKEEQIDKLVRFFLANLVNSAASSETGIVKEDLCEMLDNYVCKENSLFEIRRNYYVPLSTLAGALYQSRIADRMSINTMKNMCIYDLAGLLLLGEKAREECPKLLPGCTVRADGSCCTPLIESDNSAHLRYNTRLVGGRASGMLRGMLPCRRDIVDLLMMLQHVCRGYLQHLLDVDAGKTNEFSLDARLGLACDNFCQSIDSTVVQDERFYRFTEFSHDNLKRIWDAGRYVRASVSECGRCGLDNRHERLLMSHIANILHEEMAASDKFGRDARWYTRAVSTCSVAELDTVLGNRNAFAQIGELAAFLRSEGGGDATVLCFNGQTWPCDVAWALSVAAGESGIPEYRLAHLAVCEGVPYLVCAPGAQEVILQSTACVALRHGTFLDCAMMYPLVFSLLISGWDVLKHKNCPSWERLLRASIAWLIRRSTGSESTVDRYGDVETAHVLETNDKHFSTYRLVGRLVAVIAAIARTQGLYQGRVLLHTLLRLRSPCVFAQTAATALRGALEKRRRNREYDILRTALDTALDCAHENDKVVLSAAESQERTILVNTTLWCFLVDSHDTITHLFNGVTTGRSQPRTLKTGLLINNTLSPVNPIAGVDSIAFADLARTMATVYGSEAHHDAETMAARNKCADDMLWFLHCIERLDTDTHLSVVDAANETQSISPNILFNHASHGDVLIGAKSCAVAGMSAAHTMLVADFPVSSPLNGIVCSSCNTNRPFIRRIDPSQKHALLLKSDIAMDALITNRFGLPRPPPLNQSISYGDTMIRRAHKHHRDVLTTDSVNNFAASMEISNDCNRFAAEMMMSPMQIDMSTLRRDLGSSSGSGTAAT